MQNSQPTLVFNAYEHSQNDSSVEALIPVYNEIIILLNEQDRIHNDVSPVKIQRDVYRQAYEKIAKIDNYRHIVTNRLTALANKKANLFPQEQVLLAYVAEQLNS